MSAGDTGAIGPVSARYAAQIRELLQVQAVQRMAADQEAARAKAEAERMAAARSAVKAEEIRQPLAVKVEPADPAQAATSVKPAESTGEAPPGRQPPAQIIDIEV